MNNHAGVRLPPLDRSHDLVKREKNDTVECRIEKAQEKVGGGVTAGDRNPLPPEFLHCGMFRGNYQRAATAPECSPRPEETVIIADETKEMGGNLADVEHTLQDQPVEGLHVLQPLPTRAVAR